MSRETNEGQPMVLRSRRTPASFQPEAAPAPRLKKDGTPYKTRKPSVPSKTKWKDAVTPKFGPCRTKTPKSLAHAGIKRGIFEKGQWTQSAKGTLYCLTRDQIVTYATENIPGATLDVLKKHKTKKALIEYVRTTVGDADEKACQYLDADVLSQHNRILRGNAPRSSKHLRMPCAPRAKQLNGSCWLRSEDVNSCVLFLTIGRTDVVPGYDTTSFVNPDFGAGRPEKQLQKFQSDPTFRFLIFAMQHSAHWRCIVVERPKNPKKRLAIEYFDSMGSADVSTHVVVTNVLDMLQKTFPDAEVIYSGRNHQHGATECGVYVVWYIMCRLAGKTPAYLSQYSLPDSAMREFRQAFFRGEDSGLDAVEDRDEDVVVTGSRGP